MRTGRIIRHGSIGCVILDPALAEEVRLEERATINTDRAMNRFAALVCSHVAILLMRILARSVPDFI
jgi:hypothetical protein